MQCLLKGSEKYCETGRGICCQSCMEYGTCDKACLNDPAMRERNRPALCCRCRNHGREATPMAGTRQPTDVVVANGRKHLSKTEEAERRGGEVKVPRPKTIKVPKWVPEQLKGDFRRLGKQLLSCGLYTDLDADTLGRYLVAQHQYLIATQETEKALAKRDQEEADSWGRIQERYFKQARNCANDMGLTVTSRCRLVVPNMGAGQQKPEDDNPFLQLIQGGARKRA